MPRANALAVRTATCALAAVLVFTASSSTAQLSPRRAVRVAVGEMGGEGSDQALTSAVTDALAAHPEVQLTRGPRAQLVLRGSVVRWDRTEARGGDREVRCEVSLIVADARGGAIRAMLRGRGGARGGASPTQLSDDALRAAVRSALRPLASAGPTLALAR